MTEKRIAQLRAMTKTRHTVNPVVKDMIDAIPGLLNDIEKWQHVGRTWVDTAKSLADDLDAAQRRMDAVRQYLGQTAELDTSHGFIAAKVIALLDGLA